MPLSSCPLLTLKDGDAERGRWEDSKRAQVPASGLPVRSPNTQVGVGGDTVLYQTKSWSFKQDGFTHEKRLVREGERAERSQR